MKVVKAVAFVVLSVFVAIASGHFGNWAQSWFGKKKILLNNPYIRYSVSIVPGIVVLYLLSELLL
jgi:hypothetical protein